MEFDRDFIVRDQHGNIIIKAISTWVIMDINERKLKRSDLININYPQMMKERAIADKFAKIKSFGRIELAYQKVIGYSDIDFNGHLNNSKYVDYIMDCFQWDDHIINTVKTIELHFHHEALPGDTLTLHKDISIKDSNLIYIEGVSKNDQNVVFKSQLEMIAK